MDPIDRRNFLGLFSASALSAIAPFDRLVRLSRATFSSPALGLSFEIPDGWFHWSIEEIIANRERQCYVEDHRDQDDHSPAPMIAFSRYKEPYPDLNPGVCIYADRRAGWMGNDIVALTDSITEYFSTIVRNSQISQAIDMRNRLGCESAKSTIIYDVVCNDGFSCRVVDGFLLVFHRQHLLFLQFEQSFDSSERADKEFDSIERTVRLT